MYAIYAIANLTVNGCYGCGGLRELGFGTSLVTGEKWMTKKEYANESAKRLALCESFDELNAVLSEIDETLERSDIPTDDRDFWQEVEKQYPSKPRPLFRESTAAAALNRLVAAAQQVLQQRATGK
jgi:hypothetical protein